MKNKTQQHREHMFRLIEDCHNSGLSKKQWCQQNGIPKSRFFYWQNQYRKAREQNSKAAFIELPAPDKQPTAMIELEYPSGLTIRIPQQAGASFIASVIKQAGHV